MRLYTVSRQTFDPYQNLALEHYLLENVPNDCCVLYLWQNEPTVVIGRNQNPWSECRTGLLQEDGVHLARRYSGGGAVYHDLGNMNFTFVAKEDCYDQDRQFSVITAACESLGIPVERSGRNDLMVNGFKFSGNAFLHHAGAACHHGTLLISSDFTRLSSYLTPPKAKLQAKGIPSVRSRVTNLIDFCPQLSTTKMADALLQAFEQVYSGKAEPYPLPADADRYLNLKAAQLQDQSWLYGNRMAMTCSVEDKFTWGHIRIEFQVTDGRIRDLAVFTDSLDWTLSDRIQKALLGEPFQKAAMLEALKEALSDDVLADMETVLNV